MPAVLLRQEVSDNTARDTTMEVGSWVKVHGLVGAPEHNGKYGVAKSFAGE